MICFLGGEIQGTRGPCKSTNIILKIFHLACVLTLILVQFLQVYSFICVKRKKTACAKRPILLTLRRAHMIVAGARSRLPRLEYIAMYVCLRKHYYQ